MPSKKSVTRWTGATRLPDRERGREREREREREIERVREREEKKEREKEREKQRENGEDDVNSITRKGDEINERIGHNRKRRELLKTSTQWRQSAVKVKFDKCFNTANSVHPHVI